MLESQASDGTDATIQQAVDAIGHHLLDSPSIWAMLLYDACQKCKNSFNVLDDINLAGLASWPPAGWELLARGIQLPGNRLAMASPIDPA
eukprot:3064054-Amphidinium_carterae.1